MLLNPWQKQDAVGPENPLTIFELRMGEVDDGRLYFSWKLSEECFPPGFIDSMWQAFNGLLSRLADAPVLWERSRLDFALSVEDAVVYLEGELPRGVLHDSLNRWAAEAPYKTAVETAAGLTTYQSLSAQSNVVASTLRLLGIKQGELVPVVMDRGAFFVSTVLGILKAGAAFVAVKPSTCRELLHAILKNTGARVVLTQTHYALITEWSGTLEVVSVDKLSPLSGNIIPLTVEPDSLAYVLHTADESKYPKGIMIDHLGALNTIADINQRFEVGPGDKVLGVSSCSSDRFVYDIFGMLQAGATVVYPEPGHEQNPLHWIEVMSGKGVTLWNSDTATASLLVEVAGGQSVVLPGLRLFMLSADDISIELLAQIRRFAPNAVIVRLGGASEVSIWSSYEIVENIDKKQQKRLMGKPLSNQGWLISDAIGRRTPTWTAGELCLIGAGLSPGYWADERETRRRFNKVMPSGVRLFRTGRRGRYLPDGSIELLSGAIAQSRPVGRQHDLIEIDSDLGVTPAKAVTSEMLPGNEEKKGNNFRHSEKSVSHAFTLLTVLQELQVFLKGQLQQITKGDEIQDTNNLAIGASKGKTGLRLKCGMSHIDKNAYFGVDGQTNEGEKSCNRPLTKELSGSGIEQ